VLSACSPYFLGMYGSPKGYVSEKSVTDVNVCVDTDQISR
jgi:hypothetical protein